jgi:hypothetical protein
VRLLWVLLVSDLRLFRLAQELTDRVFGKDTYVGLNHFDPSKGETRQHARQVKRRNPLRSKQKKKVKK